MVHDISNLVKKVLKVVLICNLCRVTEKHDLLTMYDFCRQRAIMTISNTKIYIKTKTCTDTTVNEILSTNLENGIYFVKNALEKDFKQQDDYELVMNALAKGTFFGPNMLTKWRQFWPWKLFLTGYLYENRCLRHPFPPSCHTK